MQCQHVTRRSLLVAVATLVTFTATTRAAHAIQILVGTPIVQDSFNANDLSTGDDINGRTPNINLPGGTWAVANQWGGGHVVAAMGESVGRIDTDNSARVSIASSGPYVKPVDLHIEARFTTIATGTDLSMRGALLGFSNVSLAGGTSALFGVVVRGSDGRVGLVENSGALTQSFPYSGVWNNAVFHDLSYRIHTNTGSISDVVLDGVSYGFTSSAFTNANTQYALFTASSQTGGSFYTFADNFLVANLQSVPEPSTLALLGLGAIGMAIKARRRRAAA